MKRPKVKVPSKRFDPEESTRDLMPIAHIEWLEPEELRANGWNPNHVAPHEWALLKTSLMEDGWTQPLVATSDGLIVDGFHRWSLACDDPEVRALGDGCVPVARLAGDERQQRLATVRHNRARGSHYVRSMVTLVNELFAMGLTAEELEKRLGMTEAEVVSIINFGNMPSLAGSERGMGPAWTNGQREK